MSSVVSVARLSLEFDLRYLADISIKPVGVLIVEMQVELIGKEIHGAEILYNTR
jgi:hypothetical protein